MSKANVYEIVTNRIIEGLQDKGLSWFRPWTNSNGDFQLPINNTTGKAYNGVNLFILGATATIEGYEHNEWITFKQAINKGGQVLKGSKSTEVVFWNISYKFEGRTKRLLG